MRKSTGSYPSLTVDKHRENGRGPCRCGAARRDRREGRGTVRGIAAVDAPVGDTRPRESPAGFPARVWEPKRLHLRLFQIAGRIARRSRRLWLNLSVHAPFGHLVATAMTRLQALPQLA